MELLYVWIEKYKNIEKQGFNFSPKYRFSFDDNTKMLSLDEDRSDKVIDNFFGEKISNITAIVGENGSGKSNLIELILQKICGFELIEEIGKNFGFVIFEKKGHKEVFYKNNDFMQIESKNCKIEEISTIQVFKGNLNCIYYSLHLDRLENIKSLNYIDISNYIIFDKTSNLDGELDYLKKDNLKILKFLLFMNGNSRFDLSSLEMISFPTKMFINIEILRKNDILKELLSNFGEQDSWENYVKIAYSFFSQCENLEATIIWKKITHSDFLENLNVIKNKVKSIIDRKSEIGINELAELCNNIDFLKEEFDNIQRNLKYFGFSNGTAEISLSRREFDFYDKFLAFYTKYSVLGINVKWENNLATGFNNLLSFMSRCFEKRDIIYKKLPTILMIDEGETGLHPKLQAQYLSILVEFFNQDFVFQQNKDQKLQIILTTHSPFILSDLPKENVVFLKNKDGKCQVQNGLNDMKQTFGANIHTLLSDGFFMDGLAGKFSSDKINEVIQYLNNETVEGMDDEKAEKIINLIGEPIIKRYLTQQLSLKKQNITFETVKDLEKRIAELEKNQGK